MNATYLSGLIDKTVNATAIRLAGGDDGPPEALMPAQEKVRFVNAALAAMQKPYRGRFEIVWRPDDGAPF